MAILNLFKYVKDQITFPAGQIIFTEDETGDVMYVVVEGEVEISHRGQTIETVGPGGLIGEMALIDHKTRSATATARTDVKLVGIDQQRFTFMVEETPFFAIEVMKIMTERLRREREKD
ncbi:MAG: cyclic nucleotide-binding domain-containing protein [Anaerolineae bacterium]|nr:cyclic nucleotide-binding domain-containing protein [Anaerolineae bacterium]MBN8620456.1 cyclic nucleotide-binding domain-containing protein [Anaerolineae bacterium]